MNEMMTLVAAAIAGLILGLLFFAGLWWTTRKGIASDQPALWFVGSLLARTGPMLAGLYYVGASDWHSLLVCLAGVMIARAIVLRVSAFAERDPVEINAKVKHGS